MDEHQQKNDYWSVNAVAEPIAGVMPIVHVVTDYAQDMVFFGLIKGSGNCL